MTDDQPEVTAERTPATNPQQPRPKMTLDQQAGFLGDMLRRCEMHTGDMKGQYAGEAVLTLTRDDMLALETVQQTLRVFDLWRADRMVKDAIDRKKRARG